ncbi:MAG: alpha-glucan family phosphorylase [Acidobacteriota bacterium]
MITRLETFQVVPAIPERLLGLQELAYNLLWSWDEEMRVVFSRVDRNLWLGTNQNPVALLGLVSQQRLEELAADDSFMSFYERVYERFKAYLKETTWWDKRYQERPLVAYFSTEYGLTECLPIYSGGLGVLSADHLKSASDLGLPLVGVGLLYQQGYFRQYLTSDGWQQESYPINDFYNLPISRVQDAQGNPLRIVIWLAGERLLVEVWKAQVGRLPLYLLDTNAPENPKHLQDITDQLYGGDQETRIRQEIVLGVGGLRALHAMGLRPSVCHMNEGHSAFLSIERIRILMKENGLTFAEALEAARAGAVFTTHTSVPAGFDIFPPELVDKYFGETMREMGVSRDVLLGLGRNVPTDPQEGLNMAVLAVHCSSSANGVSRLHGEVSRALLRQCMPSVPEHEVPVGHVTNGAHTRSWISREMAALFDRYLGAEWWRRPGQPITWEGVDSIPDEEIWATHERRRERLVSFTRRRLVRQLEQRGAAQALIERARGIMDTRTLTIGFARRFATYKRANLLLRDQQRLKKILLDPNRPVQLIFAGKAHPRDTEAKEILKSIVGFCQQDDMRRHAVFLEDYDLVIARYLVQGCDVWLNTPRRGMEASGTSGIKVLPNGVLNLSILDGWWCEGFQPDVGWAIGKGEDYQDHSYQDYVESNALFDLLENDIVPLFYQRQADGLPRGWIARMKRSMKTLCPAFSSNRMLWEYAERYYLPAARYYASLTENNMARARDLAAWKKRLREGWSQVRIEGVEATDSGTHRVGEGYEVKAKIRLGSIAPAHVSVELYYGALDAQRQIVEPRGAPMRLDASLQGGLHRYVGVIPCDRSGLQGYTVRVIPFHPDTNNTMSMGLIAWW